MLQTLREKITGGIAIAFVLAIGLSLVVSFGNIDTGFTSTGTALTVNGEDVPLSEFRAVYQNQKQQWEANFRAQIPPELAESMATSVIDSIARNRVVTQHVREQGYRVNDADVVEAIASNPAFFVGGKFSQPAYEQLLGSQGYTPERFEYEQRQGMQLEQFVEGIAFSAFYTPEEFRRYIALDGESRSIEYAVLPAELWVDEVSVSDEAVAARYEAEIGLHKTTEQVSLEYVEIDFATLLESTTLDPDDVRQYYDDNIQDFSEPNERLARHILVAIDDDQAAAEAEITRIAAELAAGGEFGELAGRYSDDTGTAALGGELGWLGSGDAPAPEFEAALFALQAEGDVSEPVLTDFGYHLIQLGGVRPGGTMAFADVRDDLAARLREDEAADRFTEMVDELDERALESLTGLAPVAEAMGLELRTVEAFTRSGNEELGFSPELVDAVFSLEVLEDGENSPVVSLPDERAVVVRVTDYRPAETKPLTQVAELIRVQLEDEEALGLGAIATAGAVDRLNAGEDPGVVFDAFGVTTERLEDVRRGEPDVPADLVAAAFRAPRPVDGPGDYRSLLLGSGGYAVFRVTDSRYGSPENFSLENRDLRKTQLAQRLGGGQATAVVETLVDDAKVVLVPDLLENELGLE